MRPPALRRAPRGAGQGPSPALTRADEDAPAVPGAPPPAPPPPIARPRLVFSGGSFDHASAAHDLSALAFAGGTLWTAGDERAAVERFVRQPDGSFAGHARHPLGRLLDLPDDDPEAEMDIEGVDIEDGWLWVAGSHSLRRRRPDPEKEKDPAELIRRLARLDRQPNRYTLARLPLVTGPDGHPDLPAGGDASDGREPAALRHTGRGSRLSKLLAEDEHLSPFLDLPAKENGFDIEGLAVRHGRVFLGLRGPVLRGFAVILELRPEQKGRRLRLAPFADRDGDEEDEPYRKHFLDLRGLGVRDLAFDGDDLLILVGPTLAHDGRHAVFRWRGAATADCPTLQRREELEHVLELPTVPDRDRAEGIALRRGADGAKELLVIYDSPTEARLDRKRGAVLADLFRLRY